jgi:pantoate--beta-alanine ligase
MAKWQNGKMISVTSIQEVRDYVLNAKAKGKLIGLVPTMGYLHDGHLSLVKECRKYCDIVVMSIFVNPIQFDNKDDLTAYPVDIENDKHLAESIGVDLLFIPNSQTMYNNPKTFVSPEGLDSHLCGAKRPGHFKGVLTVVSKLFNIVLPDAAIFGQKDIQQAIIITKMVDDLNFPVKIVIAPTVREESGLAMSSRNKHLSLDEKKRAVCIYDSMNKAALLIKQGERKWNIIEAAMRNVIENSFPEKIDYISAVDFYDLAPIETLKEKSIIAVAVYFGTTRLIDNMIVNINGDNNERNRENKENEENKENKENKKNKEGVTCDF